MASEDVKALMLDPRYWRGEDPEFVAMVRNRSRGVIIEPIDATAWRLRALSAETRVAELTLLVDELKSEIRIVSEQSDANAGRAEEAEKILVGYRRERHEVEQRLGTALGYPFADHTICEQCHPVTGCTCGEHWVVIGDHAPGTIAAEAANKIADLERRNAELESALKPFADEYSEWGIDTGPVLIQGLEDDCLESALFTVDDLRRANYVLACTSDHDRFARFSAEARPVLPDGWLAEITPTHGADPIAEDRRQALEDAIASVKFLRGEWNRSVALRGETETSRASIAALTLAIDAISALMRARMETEPQR